MTRLPLLAAFLIGTAAPLAAQNAAPCSASENRQFDFWAGSWTVTANDQTAGTNRITPILNGCALMEEWTGAGGSVGKSFNTYNVQTGKWQQFWVDNSGLVLELEGGLDEGRMVLTGTTTRPNGQTVRHRITWTPNPDQTVRQHWESSTDNGATWSTAFDGLYVPAEE